MSKLTLARREHLMDLPHLTVYLANLPKEVRRYIFFNLYKSPQELIRESIMLHFSLMSNAGYKKIAYQQLLGQVVEDIQQSINSFIIKNIPDYDIEPRGAAGERKAPEVFAGTTDAALTEGQAQNTDSTNSVNAETSRNNETILLQPDETAPPANESENTDADGDDDDDLYDNLLNSWGKK